MNEETDRTVRMWAMEQAAIMVQRSASIAHTDVLRIAEDIYNWVVGSKGIGDPFYGKR